MKMSFQLQLRKLEGRSRDDYPVQAWDEFPLDGIVTTNVRIEILSVYTSDMNGLTEVEFYIGSSE